jgi:hypothetical protein
LRLWLWLRLW